VLSNTTVENMVSAVNGEYIVVKSPNISGNKELDFGKTPVTEIVKANYSIRNSGKATLVINDVTFLSDGYRVTNDLPLSVADEVSIPWNMLSSGIMTVDVKNAEFTAEGIYEITIELKSKNALSVTGTTTFMADNFMVAYLGENGIEKSVMPCEISEAGEVYPYAFTLTDGEKRELTLSYGIDSVPDVLISGYSDNTLYLKLRED
jgi:hypothetical protein